MCSRNRMSCSTARICRAARVLVAVQLAFFRPLCIFSFLFFFFYNDPAPPKIYPLPLPAALPIHDWLKSQLERLAPLRVTGPAGRPEPVLAYPSPAQARQGGQVLRREMPGPRSASAPWRVAPGSPFAQCFRAAAEQLQPVSRGDERI